MKGGKPRFVVDAMLGKTARKLRLAGFDAKYAPDCEDDHILEEARQGRIIVTSDVELHARALRVGLQSLRQTGRDSLDHVLDIAESLGLKVEIDAAASRCAACNGILLRAGREAAGDPAPALPETAVFWQCSDCGKAYWHGSHIDNLRRALSERSARPDPRETIPRR